MAQYMITRREWAAALAAPAVAAAQVTTPGQTPGQLLDEVSGEIRKAAARLEGFRLSMEAEPAFMFRP